MVPWSKLLEKSRKSKLEYKPMVDGIVPENLLFFKDKYSKKLPLGTIKEGIVPDIAKRHNKSVLPIDTIKTGMFKIVKVVHRYS